MLRVYCYKTMTIEKTYKLTIKDTAYFLTEQELSSLYNACSKALNITSYPPGVTKLDSVQPTDKTTTAYPNWPAYPNTMYADVPFGTTDNSVMDWHNYHGVTGTGISTANVPSSKGINFLSDDIETIKENNNWRSSVQQALDKLSAKTNITTNDGNKVG